MFYSLNNKKIATIFIALMAGMLSCKKDFLEVVPKGVIVATKTSDYELMLNDKALNAATGSNIFMSDELAGYVPTYAFGVGFFKEVDQKAFEYQDDIYLTGDKETELKLLEHQLYTYNKVINEVMESEEGSDVLKKSLRAEALAGRAWVHLMMVNYYGKPYLASTATTDLGIPLMKVADVTQTVFTRATVQEAYDLIIADLTEAIPNLSTRIVSRHRMSRAAAEAILAKVYVYMHQFEKALPLLNASIEHFSGSGVPVDMYDYNVAFAPQGEFMPIDAAIGSPRRVRAAVDKEVVYLKEVPLNFYSFIFGGIVLNPQTGKLYNPADLRLKFLTKMTLQPLSFLPADMYRSYGKYNNMGVNVPDIYLLKAECQSRTGDLVGAVEGLKAFRRKRMSNATAADIPANIASDQIALTKFILEERIREFCVTGDRWWDMRRLSVDEIYKSTVGMVHHVYDTGGNIVKSYPLKPARLTLRFPQFIMDSTPGWPQNP